MNNVLLLLLLWVGLPAMVLSMGNIWDQTTHHIKMLYDTSKITHSSTPKIPLYGPGQGSTCCPIFWILFFCLIVDSITAIFTSVSLDLIVSTLGTAFVDDSSLGVTSTFTDNPEWTLAQNASIESEVTILSLTKVAQYWEMLLFSTGSAINKLKCFWYLIARVWKNGIPRMATVKNVPGKVELTIGSSSLTTEVPRIEVTDSGCTYQLQDLK
jgi:hypothetical protein